MPVDPQIAGLLAQLALVPPPADLAETRARAEASVALLPRREIDVFSSRDLVLDGADGPLRGRLYVPSEGGPHPLTVFFHGGGFIAYSIDTHDQLCRELAVGAHTAVLSVEYRLLPEHPTLSVIADAYAALVWAVTNAAELGVDVTKVAVAGDSAGAHLALASAMQARDRGGPTLRAQLLFYPAVDFTGTEYASYTENAQGYQLDRDRHQAIVDLFAPTRELAEHPLVSPIHFADLKELPATLIYAAEFDVLRDEDMALAGALKNAGVRSEYRLGLGMIHGFANLTGMSAAAAISVDSAAEWLRERLTDTGACEPASKQAPGISNLSL